MIKYLIVLVIIISVFSCDIPKKLNGNDINPISIYYGLKKNNIFTKFIGYHIVWRAGEDQFFYNDLRNDSTSWQTSVLYRGEDKKLDSSTELFFKKFPDAKLRFDIMRKYNIQAVITDNYNPTTKRLEYRDYGGYDFNHYALSFKLSDSISINKINFNIKEYYNLVKNNYKMVEKLDSNWLILKRL